MSHTPLLTKPWLGGTQRIYRFANGYGASVVRHAGSYGQELAVVRFDGAGADAFELVYDTPITNNVLGWLSDEQLAATLGDIAALPDPGVAS